MSTLNNDCRSPTDILVRSGEKASRHNVSDAAHALCVADTRRRQFDRDTEALLNDYRRRTIEMGRRLQRYARQTEGEVATLRGRCQDLIEDQERLRVRCAALERRLELTRKALEKGWRRALGFWMIHAKPNPRKWDARLEMIADYQVTTNRPLYVDKTQSPVFRGWFRLDERIAAAASLTLELGIISIPLNRRLRPDVAVTFDLREDIPWGFEGCAELRTLPVGACRIKLKLESAGGGHFTKELCTVQIR
jgi:hypothetical protein